MHISHHYDEHDHDKLLRWRDDLRANSIVDGEVSSIFVYDPDGILVQFDSSSGG